MKFPKLSTIIEFFTSSACERCDTSYMFAKAHKTLLIDVHHRDTGRYCEPLCEQCWDDLGTAEARLPYYFKLWERWNSDPRTMYYCDEDTLVRSCVAEEDESRPTKR